MSFWTLRLSSIPGSFTYLVQPLWPPTHFPILHSFFPHGFLLSSSLELKHSLCSYTYLQLQLNVIYKEAFLTLQPTPDRSFSPREGDILPAGLLPIQGTTMTSDAFGAAFFVGRTQGTLAVQSSSESQVVHHQSHAAQSQHQNHLQQKRSHLFEQPYRPHVDECLCEIRFPLLHEEGSHKVHHEFGGSVF